MGIATQTVVEKRLLRAHRTELVRAFAGLVRQWKTNMTTITEQLQGRMARIGLGSGSP